MIKLETDSDSDNDKHNKHLKYTLDEALQAVLKLYKQWIELRLKY